MSTLFVLGSERSGSTWLANILDAHPDVELLMEPFAARARLFPGFPDREVPVDDRETGLATRLRRGIARVPVHKYPLLYRPGRSRVLRVLDTRLADAARALAHGLRRPTPLWIRRLELLHLNAAALPVDRLPVKPAAPSVLAVKELRLNFKVGLVAAAFPEARVIAVVRGPVAQIASIERLIARGRLRELAAALPRILETVTMHPRFARYARLTALVDPQDRSSALAIWWLVSNQTLLADLRGCKLAHLVIRHEDLCEEPLRGAETLLRFAGLPPDRAVTRFVRWSSSGDAITTSPVDTRRHSKLHTHRALEAAPADLRRRVERVLLSAAELDAVDPETITFFDRAGPSEAGFAAHQRDTA
jgi:hypothetical protein